MGESGEKEVPREKYTCFFPFGLTELGGVCVSVHVCVKI